MSGEVMCIVCLVTVCMMGSRVQSLSISTQQNMTGDERAIPGNHHRISFDDVHHHLRTVYGRSREQGDDVGRDRRDAVEMTVNATSTNETAFEDYERMYLKNRTLNYIRQIYYYSRFRDEQLNNDSSMIGGTNNTGPTSMPGTYTTDSDRTDAVLDQLLEEVNETSLSELIEGLKDIEEVAERGLMDTGIASLCCPLG